MKTPIDPGTYLAGFVTPDNRQYAIARCLKCWLQFEVPYTARDAIAKGWPFQFFCPCCNREGFFTCYVRKHNTRESTRQRTAKVLRQRPNNDTPLFSDVSNDGGNGT